MVELSDEDGPPAAPIAPPPLPPPPPPTRTTAPRDTMPTTRRVLGKRRRVDRPGHIDFSTMFRPAAAPAPRPNIEDDEDDEPPPEQHQRPRRRVRRSMRRQHLEAQPIPQHSAPPNTRPHKVRFCNKIRVIQYNAEDPPWRIANGRRTVKVDMDALTESSGVPRSDAATRTVAGRRAARGVTRTRSIKEDKDAPLAALPPPLRLSVLERWDPNLVRHLREPPILHPPGRRNYAPYVTLPTRARREVRDMISRMSEEEKIETVGIFARWKEKKHEWRLIVDARAANARDPGWNAIGPKCPRVEDIATFLKDAKYATTADLRNFFYSIPIGRELQRLFYAPELQGAVNRLPMGWVRAPDLASRITELIVGGGPRIPGRRTAAGLICTDNILVAGPTKRAVQQKVDQINRRAAEVRATFSEKFGEPRQNVKFFGILWNIADKRRGLPADAANRMRRSLRRFAASRGPQQLHAWRRAVGTSGWISTTLSVEPHRRWGLTNGLRAAEHRVQGVVPAGRARREARRLADLAHRSVRLDAPAEQLTIPIDPRRLSSSRTAIFADAAVPGAEAAVLFRPGECGELIHWKLVPTGDSIVTAELAALAAAAQYAYDNDIERPILATDSRTCWSMVKRGTARKEKHDKLVHDIRTWTPSATLLWVRTDLNPADGPSRQWTWGRALASARRAAFPLGKVVPKRAGDGQKLLGVALRPRRRVAVLEETRGGGETEGMRE